MKRVETLYVCRVIIIISMSVFSIIGKESRESEKIKQITVGNFALPGSQQPGPLFSFGQNILDKGITELFGYVDQFKGSHYNFKSVTPLLLYGITDRLSLLVGLPMAAQFKFEGSRAHGPQDFRLQLECAVYVTETSTSMNEVTCVANIGVPTGSSTTNPPLGFGSPSFFLGFTASHTGPQWWYFISSGVLLPTSHKKSKHGNQFLYQGGLGRNIAYSPDKWVLNGLIELNGIYTQHSKLSGLIVCNSGGNSLFLGPSLWLSTQRVIMQIGISAVIFQHLFGIQPKDSYVLAAGIGWRF